MEFVVDALPVELIGVNLIMMCNCIKFCADQLLITLGCSRYCKIGNLFEWMETISLQGNTSFFEKPVKIFNIWSRGRQRRPNFCPQCQPLTPPPPTHTFISHLSLSACHTLLCSQLEHQLPPLFLHLLLPRLYGKQYTQA